MFVEKLTGTLFNKETLPEDLSQYSITHVVLFSDEQIKLLQEKSINTIADLAESWYKLADIASDNGILPLDILERASAGARIRDGRRRALLDRRRLSQVRAHDPQQGQGERQSGPEARDRRDDVGQPDGRLPRA